MLAVLKRRALEFKHTPTIGRTHGIHAEPTTFGLKILNWYAEIERDIQRFEAAAEDMRVGKLSGAVGTFGHLKPEHEERICARLGLKAAPVATQVIQRDRHAAYIATLAIIGSTLDKIALEIRHLQRTEVREAQEYFSEKQKGSSAMPHKKNPITSEQISGLARVIGADPFGVNVCIAQAWHDVAATTRSLLLQLRSIKTRIGALRSQALEFRHPANQQEREPISNPAIEAPETSHRGSIEIAVVNSTTCPRLFCRRKRRIYDSPMISARLSIWKAWSTSRTRPICATSQRRDHSKRQGRFWLAKNSRLITGHTRPSVFKDFSVYAARSKLRG